MTFLRSAALAALLSAATLAAAAAKPICHTPDEARATQLRKLQSELMVAALKCQNADMRAKYNSFVHHFKVPLENNGRVLKAQFARSGENLDRFITKLANDASIEAQMVPEYCARQDTRFDKVLTLKPAEIETFAAEGNAGPAACPTVQAAEAKDKPAPKPAAKKVKAEG